MYAVKIDLLFESALLLAALGFSLSVYVLSRGVGNKLNLSYSALTLCISVWAFSFFVANILEWRLFESVHILSTLFLAPLSLLFLNTLLRPEGWVFQWILRISLLSTLLLVPPVTFGFDRESLIRDLSYFSPSLIVVANLYLLLSETIGSVKPRGGWGDFSRFSSIEMRTTLRRRNFWLYLGGVVVTLLCVMDRVPWMGRTLPAIGNLLLALYFYFIKDAVIHQSLVSSRRILGKLLANLSGAILAFIVFILITTWVKHDPTLYLINAFFASFVTVVSIDPIRSITSFLFQNLFFQEAAKIESYIKDASKEIAGAFHAGAIAAATDRFLQRALGGKMISFYAIESDGKRFRKIYDSTTGENLPDFLPASFPLVQRFSKNKTWIPLMESELAKEAERESLPGRMAQVQLVQESLISLQSTIAFHLEHDRSVLGFATIFLKEPPERWDESWGALPLLEPYFKRAGEALHELDIYAQLRERDRLATVGEMAAGLAHEIRNPLGAIKGAAQVLDPKPGDPQEPFLKIIVEEVNKLNGVVTQFLNYAKPFRNERVWGNLKELVLNTTKKFETSLSEQGIKLAVQVPNAMPQILCQPDLIGIVLTNLILNAEKAHQSAKKPEKEPYISVRLAHTIREPLEISLSVEDNGPGMTPEVLDKVFIPFFTQSPQGTGLGLSICQKIAEAHGGRMEASSVPGDGTLMTLRFSAEGRDHGKTGD